MKLRPRPGPTCGQSFFFKTHVRAYCRVHVFTEVRLLCTVYMTFLRWNLRTRVRKNWSILKAQGPKKPQTDVLVGLVAAQYKYTMWVVRFYSIEWLCRNFLCQQMWYRNLMLICPFFVSLTSSCAGDVLITLSTATSLFMFIVWNNWKAVKCKIAGQPIQRCQIFLLTRHSAFERLFWVWVVSAILNVDIHF